MRRTRKPPPDVFVVTEAGRSRAEDIRARERAYIVKMLFRTACLITAIVLFAVGVPFPYLLVLIVVSTILPWMSVVSANSGPAPEPRRRLPTLGEPGRRALGPGRRED